ncbi:uncharacterized protein METZ01_LOCUS36183 [marine metagenome]|uniref:Uncharacterized protein n=1 Tax=marine metagenome TaxID=408172 RepID=A0A381QXJ5_9ZZZZ
MPYGWLNTARGNGITRCTASSWPLVRSLANLMASTPAWNRL